MNNRISLLALTALFSLAFTGIASAQPDSLWVLSNKADDYALRLDVNGQLHTFNADTTQDLWLLLDTDANQATVFGTVTHNQSGDNALAADANDDVYRINATFATPQLLGDWYGVSANNALYNNILADLFAGGGKGDSLDFAAIDLTLTRESNPTSGDLEYPQDRPLWQGVGPLSIDSGANALGGLELIRDLGPGGLSGFSFGLRPGLPEVGPSFQIIDQPPRSLTDPHARGVARRADGPGPDDASSPPPWRITNRLTLRS